ncbi:MAG: hypothetical protein IJV88_05650 [Ruminococcus sp.]|nr:hypothetical protein [Ruminococcus sp.]
MYEDIINLPHYQSTKRPHMSMRDRAAQFSPFAALTGHDEAIKETARLTDKKIELTEGDKALINEKLQIIISNLSKDSPVTITYFVKDKLKAGGKYTDHTGIIRRIDDYESTITFQDKTTVPIEDVLIIESDLFKEYNT